jgi:GT2 family glycosyltransferase
MADKATTVVTVTYGDREHLLRQVLNAVRDMDVSRVVVVDNGSAWPVKSELKAAYSDFVDVVEMGENTGSARGFATGIQRALDWGAEYVWLLDDDNRPRGDTLQKLRDAYSKAQASTPRDRLAVLAFRPEHQADVAMGVATHRINPRVNSFRGFHVLDIPYKIWRRTPWGRPRVLAELPATVSMEQAPYSGLLFHRDLIQSIGLPNADFVLYADDNEFTYRIAKKGGRTLLVTSAMIDDLESSWNVKARFGNGFVGNLEGVGDFRAYYAMRNGVYFDVTNMNRNGFAFWVNRSVYMAILFVFSIILGKRARYRLLLVAVHDGLAGRLGVNKAYPL